MTMRTFAVLALALVSTLAAADTYTKRGAEAEIARAGDKVNFTIASTAGQARCELEGVAEAIDQNRYAWTDADPKDRCVAVLNLNGGKLAVTTKGCEGYCGVGAAGSMDGAYAKAK